MIAYKNRLINEIRKFSVHPSSSCLQNFYKKEEEALGTPNLDKPV